MFNCYNTKAYIYVCLCQSVYFFKILVVKPSEDPSLSIVSLQELDLCSSCHSGNSSMKKGVGLTVDPKPSISHSIIPSTNFSKFELDFKTDQDTEASSRRRIYDVFGNVDDVFDTNLERKRIENEINSALKSLKTNFLLTLAFLVLCLILYFLPNIISLVVISVAKGMIPLLTSITNFDKISNLFHSYIANFSLKFRS